MFIAFVFLIFFELLWRFEIYDVRIWVGVILLGLIEWVLLVMLLLSHAFILVSHFLVVYLACAMLGISCS